jgi:osmotically-inducible protein OsmY
MTLRPYAVRLAALLAIVTAVPAITGCVALGVAAVGTGVMVAADRRSAGAQVDDQTIELKVATDAGSRWGDKLNVTVTSFNGLVLLTGEAANQGIIDDVVKLAKSVDRVRIVESYMVVAPLSDLPARTNDASITSMVKARMVEANKFPPNAVKVVTERKVVYLMGIVTRQEGDDAAQLAATTAGVATVVKVFQYKD